MKKCFVNKVSCPLCKKRFKWTHLCRLVDGCLIVGRAWALTTGKKYESIAKKLKPGYKLSASIFENTGYRDW